MTTSMRAGICLALSIATAMPVPLVAAALQPPTEVEYEAYVAAARQTFRDRRRTDAGPADASRAVAASPGARSAAVEAEGRIVRISGGLVHHWRATTFLRGVTLDRVLSVTQAYHDYSRMHRAVTFATVLTREANTFRVVSRLEGGSGPVTAVLDVWSVVTYERFATCAHSFGRAYEIREVENAGDPDERHLPAGRDRGFLWRADTFTRFVERDGGVGVETETLGLSRRFPRLLGWLIEPIALRVGRASAEQSLMELQDAVVNTTS
jgi:hypothetical protein